ncbi:hypothetical protein [Streptomyces sp. NPDC055036]
MPNRIAHIFEQLLKLLIPAHGCHRATKRTTPPGAPSPFTPPRTRVTLLRGEDSALVRPYLVAHEERLRRRALWLAVHGVDIGPRQIHGAKVAV